MKCQEGGGAEGGGIGVEVGRPDDGTAVGATGDGGVKNLKVEYGDDGKVNYIMTGELMWSGRKMIAKEVLQCMASTTFNCDM